MKNYFDLFIADEVHEYKGRGSAQGIAAGTIAECCPKTLTLTGTLMGGYSSTMFHMLYRFSPNIRTDFGHADEKRWVDRYGFIERIEKNADEGDVEDGRQSRRKGYRSIVREKPGITPDALFHIIGNTVFLRLHDVADALPPYTEVIQLHQLSKIPDDTGYSQASAYAEVYNTLRSQLTKELQRGSKRLLSTYLQTLLAYPDGCTRGETIMDPDGEDPLIMMPPLDPTVIYPKERALIDFAKEEKRNGRRVLVYVTHTGTRDITPRLKTLLDDHNLSAQVLKSDTVIPERREAWVADRVQEGADVLICHPRLVQTGLDLIDFPSIIWYETDYSVYTMRQASRRSWRIGQNLPVKVVFMGYHKTIHTDALKLIAQKLQSSLAVEGELPDEGLSTYQNDQEDMILALARRIANDDDIPSSNDDSLESVQQAFAKATAAETESMDLLVDDEWRIPDAQPTAPEDPAPEADPKPDPVVVSEPSPEPQPVSASAPEERHDPTAPTLLSWDQLLVLPDSPKPSRRRTKEPPASQNLFDWALGTGP